MRSVGNIQNLTPQLPSLSSSPLPSSSHAGKFNPKRTMLPSTATLRPVTSMTLLITLVISTLLELSTIPVADAFRVGAPPVPMKLQPLNQHEIYQHLGVKNCRHESQSSQSGVENNGEQYYHLVNEHEVQCPLTASHQGILCQLSSLSTPSSVASVSSDSSISSVASIFDSQNAESIANNSHLVSQVILAGSLAAAMRTARNSHNLGNNNNLNNFDNFDNCSTGDNRYYLPFVVTLVESFLAEEVSSLWDSEDGCSFQLGKVSNSDGNNVNDKNGNNTGSGETVLLYACNTNSDQFSTTSDVYIVPEHFLHNSGNGDDAIHNKSRVWKFTIEYKVATINLSQIPSFGLRGGGEMRSRIYPDVWLKDDCY